MQDQLLNALSKAREMHVTTIDTDMSYIEEEDEHGGRFPRVTATRHCSSPVSLTHAEEMSLFVYNRSRRNLKGMCKVINLQSFKYFPTTNLPLVGLPCAVSTVFDWALISGFLVLQSCLGVTLLPATTSLAIARSQVQQ